MERVRILYKQARPAILVGVLVAAIVCLMLWQVTEPRRLVIWFGVTTLVAMVRLWLTRIFARSDVHASASGVWEMRFLVTVALTSATWGIGGWWILPPDSMAHKAALYMFLMGMAGGAAVSYAAHAGCVIVTITLMMVPVSTEFVLSGDALLRIMALGGLIYIGTAQRASKMLSESLEHTYQLSEDLHVAHQEAQEQARTDALTGLRNRRAFFEVGDHALQISKRHGHSFSAIALDIDHFKKINDTWGHAAGDAALRAVASVIQETIRASDVSGRLGGEEFGILLPETSADQAKALAERLRAKIARISLPDYATIRFTASFGVAECDTDNRKLEPLMVLADACLYEAKAAGRDRVICFGTEMRAS